MSAAPPTVRTRRLLLRASRDDDVDALYAVQGDREAMAHTWWAPDREAVAARLEAYAARHAGDGFSPWTAELRDGGEVIGWGGLCVDPFDPAWGPEVAYFVHPRLWGRGLASEIVEAALALAFRELALPAVGAFARPQNAASLRVLEKQGFRFVRYLPDMDRNQYAIDQERYQACRD